MYRTRGLSACNIYRYSTSQRPYVLRYTKCRRSQGPCFEGLALYSEVILAVLRVAPNGLPNFSCLREAIKLLDESIENLHKTPLPHDVFLLQSAGRLKLMSQHVRKIKLELSKAGAPQSVAVQKLLDAMCICTAESDDENLESQGAR